MTKTDWTPWIDHDGRGCPEWVRGRWVQFEYNEDFHFPPGEYRDGRLLSSRIGEVVAIPGPAWDWTPGYYWIIRYRIRRDPSVQVLADMIAALEQPRVVEVA